MRAKDDLENRPLEKMDGHLVAPEAVRTRQGYAKAIIKILHIVFTWWPDPAGGTEVYVKGLVAELQKMGVKNVVAAPAAARSDMGYGIWDIEWWIERKRERMEAAASFKEQDGIRVWRFRCSDRPGDLGEIYGEGDPVAAESFKKVLDEERPDIVHFHAWSPAVSILLVREVKRRGIRMVQTYHTPTLSCPRGTLMRWGRTVCDGDLAKRPCALCAIQGKLRKGYGISDMGYGKAEAGSRIQGAGKSLTECSRNHESEIRNPKESKLSALASKFTTMIRMPGLIRKRTEVIRELFRTADKIVALNQWTKELLRVNGVEEGKIELIRHGIPETGCRMPDSGINKQSAEGIGGLTPVSRNDAKGAEGMEQIQDIGYRISDIGSKKDAEQKKGDNGEALKLVFLGRVAPEKGIDVLLRAMQMVKISVKLDVYGIGSKDMEYGISDIGLAKVRWLEPVKPEKVVETIGMYDALVVPSVWLETGPLVVLEAFAAGVPVIGSRLGGIAEMVQDGVDGVLFEPGDPAALAVAMVKFDQKQIVLRGNIKKQKEVRRVAQEHSHLYRSLI